MIPWLILHDWARLFGHQKIAIKGLFLDQLVLGGDQAREATISVREPVSNPLGIRCEAGVNKA